MKILLVEDNPDDAFFIQRMLPGNDFIHAESLKAALDYLRTKPELDLILLDLGLPDSGGQETFEAILQHSRGVVTVVITGYVMNETAADAYRAGVKECIGKDTLSSIEMKALLIRVAQQGG